MKKIVSLLLCLALVLGLSASALAEEVLIPESTELASGETGQDEAMKQVIVTVKRTLDLNTDAYTQFNSDSYVRGQQVWWSLYWYKDDGNLSVTADETGKIYSYYCYDYNQSYRYTENLHFPDYGYADAVRDGNAFLAKVLGSDEAVVWEENTDSLRSGSRYGLYGYLSIRGVPTETYVSLSLNTDNGTVMNFYRGDEGSFISGGVPSEIPAFDAAAALPMFAPAVSSELQWVVTDYETMEARLMYVFNRDSSVVLDAQTGELVGAEHILDAGNGKAEATMDAAPDVRDYDLTWVETAGAEKYVGVLEDAALLAAAKAEPAFGITDAYTISNVRYQPNQVTVDPALLEDGAEVDESVDATYTLRYTLTGADMGLSEKEYQSLLEEGYQPTVNKSFTADAHTGEVKQLNTWYSGFGWGKHETETEPTISQTAQDFLNTRYGDYLPLTELHSATQSDWGMPVNSFRYVRMHEGYPLYDNNICVTVNAATGYVDSFFCEWDEDVTFGPAAPLVGEDAALESYLATYEAKLCYTLLPEDPDNRWDSAYYWLLAYQLDSDSWCWQVDAVTGEADVDTYSYVEEKIAYTDLSESYAEKEIQKLADYGVGFYGVEQFQPDKEVTELDMLLFLLSADGYRYSYQDVENMDEEELSWLYRSAKNEGFIDTLEQNPNRLVKRSELCHSFVALADMTEAAGLKGIFACGFTDDGDIAAEDYGFVAIAKGLGIVSGDAAGTFRPNDGATRQELALMLYRYLSR